MYNVYTRLAVPDVPKDVLEPGLVCAASWNQQWYRVQVSKDGTAIVLGGIQILNLTLPNICGNSSITVIVFTGCEL